MAESSHMQSGQVTMLLQAWRRGDEQALHKLTALVYPELKRLARRNMNRERAGHTLETTELVHETYMHLVGTPRVDWRDRAHFFALRSTLMRRVLVDHVP